MTIDANLIMGFKIGVAVGVVIGVLIGAVLIGFWLKHAVGKPPW